MKLKSLYLVFAATIVFVASGLLYGQAPGTTGDPNPFMQAFADKFALIYAAVLPIITYLSERIPFVKKYLTNMRVRVVIIAALLAVTLVGLGAEWKSFLVPFFTSPFLYEWVLKPIFGKTSLSIQPKGRK